MLNKLNNVKYAKLNSLRLNMREYFAKSQAPFHIYARGTEKRKIFMDYAEHCRFVFLMWVCRIGRPKINLSKKETIKAAEAILHGQEPDEDTYVKEFDPLVSIITWTLMPNHYHFMLLSLSEGGISKYMQKLGNAYTKYFNARHKRSGRLFQGSFQSIGVEDPIYLAVLLRYINFNHVELIEPRWKEHQIKDLKKMEEFINSYTWSANQDFLGKRQSLLVDRELASQLLEAEFTEKGLEGYKDFINQWLDDDFESIKEYMLES